MKQCKLSEWKQTFILHCLITWHWSGRQIFTDDIVILYTGEIQWHNLTLKLNTWFEWVFKIWIIFHLKIISDHCFCCFVYCKPPKRFNLFSFIDFDNLSEWLANLRTKVLHVNSEVICSKPSWWAPQQSYSLLVWAHSIKIQILISKLNLLFHNYFCKSYTVGMF